MEVLHTVALREGQGYPDILVSDCDYPYLSPFTWHWSNLELAPYRVIPLEDGRAITRWLAEDLAFLACGRPRTLIPRTQAIYNYQRSRFCVTAPTCTKRYHGVTYHKGLRCWIARIIVNKTRTVSRTGFKSEFDAAMAHDALCALHNRLDCLNFLDLPTDAVYTRAFDKHKNG